MILIARVVVIRCGIWTQNKTEKEQQKQGRKWISSCVLDALKSLFIPNRCQLAWDSKWKKIILKSLYKAIRDHSLMALFYGSLRFQLWPKVYDL